MTNLDSEEGGGREVMSIVVSRTFYPMISLMKERILAEKASTWPAKT